MTVTTFEVSIWPDTFLQDCCTDNDLPSRMILNFQFGTYPATFSKYLFDFAVVVTKVQVGVTLIWVFNIFVILIEVSKEKLTVLC